MSATTFRRRCLTTAACALPLLAACHRQAPEPSPLPALSAAEVERCGPVADSVFRVPVEQLPLAQPIAGQFELPAPVPGEIRNGGRFAMDVRVAEYGRADVSTIVFHSPVPRGYQDKVRRRLAGTWFRPAEARGCRVPGVFRLNISFVGKS